MTDREIEVFIDLPGTAPGEPSGRTERVGTLWTRTARGRESASFRYHPDWLASPRRFALEPAMQVGEGDFVPSRRRAIFGSLGDSAPDTWGRRLMQRAERRAAEREGRAVRTLTQADYLLGVSDVSRLGALRLREAGQDAFQAVSGPHTVPPLVELPRLLATTDRLHRGEESEEDVRLLFAPGSSLGGARPKASVRDSRNRLWIAKLAKPDDDYSIERWEAVAMDLAARAGIRVPEHDLVDIAGRPALLTKRFDRFDGPSGRGAQQRVPFLSALAMLDLEDGERSSYPEIVDALRPDRYSESETSTTCLNATEQGLPIPDNWRSPANMDQYAADGSARHSYSQCKRSLSAPIPSGTSTRYSRPNILWRVAPVRTRPIGEPS